MKPLAKYQDYTRKDVHDIFDPHSPFRPGCGVWGMHGYIELTHARGNFVFFVTIGMNIGEHSFDEGITDAGVLSWQSQPGQGLADERIRKLISHDELKNSVHLFLRTRRGAPYTYLGKLKYLSHDLEREHPVYFQWQILDWDVDKVQLARVGVVLTHTEDLYLPNKESNPLNKLFLADIPRHTPRKGAPTRTYQGTKKPDYSDIDAKNKRVGDLGEALVIEHEKDALILSGHPELVTQIRHTSSIQGDSAGYDIESVTPDGKIKYIEVKATRGGSQTPFYMSSNEMEFSRTHSAEYYLYRVYDLNPDSRCGKLFIVNGDVQDSFSPTPIQYRMGLRERERGE